VVGNGLFSRKRVTSARVHRLGGRVCERSSARSDPSWTAIIIGRFADGKLAEDWVEYDRLGLYRQLGVIPLGG
jgi:hypothetical protein